MSEKTEQMVPMFSIVSNDFEKDLGVVKGLFAGLERMSHSDNAYRLSDRAEFAAGWWFYDVYVTEEFAKQLFALIVPGAMRNPKRATSELVEALQAQLKKYGTDAKIKLHGSHPFAARWFAWLMS